MNNLWVIQKHKETEIQKKTSDSSLLEEKKSPVEERDLPILQINMRSVRYLLQVPV